MGKNKKKGASGSYKPQTFNPASKPISKPEKLDFPKHVSSKAAKLLEMAPVVKLGGDTFKKELHVTDEMFEAAKLMKGGVAHIKDLDMTVLQKQAKPTDGKHTYTAQVTLIDIFTNEVSTTQVQLNKERLTFDFNSEKDFNADADTVEVATKAWDWLLNPIGLARFKKEIKDKKIMIL